MSAFIGPILIGIAASLIGYLLRSVTDLERKVRLLELSLIEIRRGVSAPATESDFLPTLNGVIVQSNASGEGAE